MAFRKSGCFFLFLAILSLSYCGPNLVELSGDIFIVTKGRANIKLGLVEVNIFRASEMEPIVEKKNLEKEQFTEKYKEALIKYEAEAKAITTELEKAVKTDSGKFLEVAGELARRMTEFKQIYEESNKKKEYYDSIKFYLDGLPSPAYIAKTDSDGRFTIRIKPGKYGLIANSSREVFNNTEEYNWMIWVTVNKRQDNRVILSNDNLTTSLPSNIIFDW